MIVRATLALFLVLNVPSVAQADDVQHYVIDTERSWIRVLVYRAGLMSVFGHNHVIASYDINGTVDCGAEVKNTTVELFFPVESLQIDRRDLRDLEGGDFSRKISEKDISATRKNMLGDKVLNADDHALLRIKSTEVTGEVDSFFVTADVTVAGRKNSISFPASAIISESTVTISGTATIRHVDLELIPFSAGFGTLKVHQELTVRFEITAVRDSKNAL